MRSKKNICLHDETFLAKLFSPILPFIHVAVAVSGGGDSTALMVLLDHWAQHHHPLLKITILTVDHGLRDSSQQEALTVQKWAQHLGLSGHILKWEGQKPISHLQEMARKMRYHLLEKAAQKYHAQAILTAHTLEDQAETFLMRLARGSGVDGLSDMNSSSIRLSVPVIRPFLGIHRQTLRDFLTTLEHPWFEDESNQNEQFERIRFRKLLPVLESTGLSVSHIGLTAQRMARARHALEILTKNLYDTSVTPIHDQKYFIATHPFFEAPQELRIRLLAKILTTFNQKTPFMELQKIERLEEWMFSSSSSSRTLGPCLIKRMKDGLLILRAPVRRHG